MKGILSAILTIFYFAGQLITGNVTTVKSMPTTDSVEISICAVQEDVTESVISESAVIDNSIYDEAVVISQIECAYAEECDYATAEIDYVGQADDNTEIGIEESQYEDSAFENESTENVFETESEYINDNFAEMPEALPAGTETETQTANEEILYEQDYTTQVFNEISARGTYGRLKIGDIGTDVAVFYTENLYSLQSVVDAEDSACMFYWTDGSMIIADHVHQGFSGLKYSVPYATIAQLYTVNGVSDFICTTIIYDGWNNGSALTYNDGTPVTAGCGELIFYTCNGDGTITITLWSGI